jgi:hypothetical protein
VVKPLLGTVIDGPCAKQRCPAVLDGFNDVLFANLKRAEEAARVLEEIIKINNRKRSGLFKQVRFALYDFEKKG